MLDGKALTCIEKINHHILQLSDSKQSFNNPMKDKVLSNLNYSKSFKSFAKNIPQNFCKRFFSLFIDDNEMIFASKGRAWMFVKLFTSNSTRQPPANVPLPYIPRVNYEMPVILFGLETILASGINEVLAIVFLNCSWTWFHLLLVQLRILRHSNFSQWLDWLSPLEIYLRFGYFLDHSWHKSFEFHGKSQIIAFDTSKAFDEVWTSNLITFVNQELSILVTLHQTLNWTICLNLFSTLLLE